MKDTKKWGMLLLGLIIILSAYADMPASVTYLNSKMAVIQAEVNAIHLRVYGN